MILIMPKRTVVRTTVVRSGSSHLDQIWIWATIIALVALIFTIISVAAPGWDGRSVLKNCGSYCLGTTVLSFIAIFLLVLGIISTVLFAKGLITSFSSTIKMSAVIFLALAGVAIVAAYASYGTHRPNNYSYYLMITSGIFTFISSIIVAFWLGRNWITV